MTLFYRRLGRCSLMRYSIAAIVLVAFVFCRTAWADGTITHLSGPVSVLKADGSRVAGANGVRVLVGDSVITGANGFARIEMSDGSEMVARPNTQLKIDAYKFDKDRPTEDSSSMSVLKGGMRTVTGLIGKRGNQDAYQLKTPSAIIGIRGTQFDMRFCSGDCGTLPNGTYVKTTFGSVVVSAPPGLIIPGVPPVPGAPVAPSVPGAPTVPGAPAAPIAPTAPTGPSQIVSAGQVGFVPPNAPPVILPRDPGIGFSPPPVIPKLDEKKKVEDQQKQQQQQQQQQPPASGGSGGTGGSAGTGGTGGSGGTGGQPAAPGGGGNLECEVTN